jgi:hypothetical protein
MSSYDRPVPLEKDDSLDKTGGVGQTHVSTEPAYVYGYDEERNAKGRGDDGYIRDDEAMDEAAVIERTTTHRGLKSRHIRFVVFPRAGRDGKGTRTGGSFA